MEKKKISTNILLTVMGALIVLEFVVRISFIQSNTLSGVLILISLAFVALYGFALYKKSHGNMLKYAMLLFAVSYIISCCTYLMIEQYFYDIITIIACAAVCYGAGRLNRIEQNKILFPIIDVIFW